MLFSENNWNRLLVPCSFDRLDKSKSLDLSFFFTQIAQKIFRIIVLTGHFLDWKRKVNLHLLEWVFTARKRCRDYTHLPTPQAWTRTWLAVNLLQVQKSYPKMEHWIEKQIKDFENWTILEHILKTIWTGLVGPGESCFRLKITVSRTQYCNCLTTAGGNSSGKRYM